MKIYIKNICIYGTTTCFFLILFHYLIKSRPSVQFILNLIIRFSGRVHNFGVGFCGTEKWGYGRWLCCIVVIIIDLLCACFSWVVWRWIGPQNYTGDSCKQWSSLEWIRLCLQGFWRLWELTVSPAITLQATFKYIYSSTLTLT